MTAQHGHAGQRTDADGTSAFNATAFLVRQMLGRVATATLVEVTAVANAGGIEPVGLVSIRPLVNQVDGAGNAQPHGIIPDVPYFRLQGGANAVILDPQIGDIGIAVFASRDISTVRATKARANPGSGRRHDMSDALYIGGLLNGAPQQYVAFADDGITVHSPTRVTIDAPQVQIDASASTTITTAQMTINGPTTINGALTQSGAPAAMSGPLVVASDVTAAGKSMATHVHGGVQTGSGNTGTPV